jgi:hypothetical protein
MATGITTTIEGHRGAREPKSGAGPEPRRADAEHAAARDRWSGDPIRRRPLTAISVFQNDDGFWAVTAQGLVVTGLTREGAEAFAEAFLRLHDEQPPAAP